MLVLARQVNERIILPTVNATIEVVAIKSNGVRLGIEAPPDVPILREEVWRRGGAEATFPLVRIGPDVESALHRIKQLVRNRLQTVALALNLLRQQMQAHPVPGLASLLRRMEDEISILDEQLRALLAESLEEVAPTVCLEGVEDGLTL